MYAMREAGHSLAIPFPELGWRVNQPGARVHSSFQCERNGNSGRALLARKAVRVGVSANVDAGVARHIYAVTILMSSE